MQVKKLKPHEIAEAKLKNTELVDLRDAARSANEQGMNEVLRESGMTIEGSRMRGWRVTKRTAGHIKGVAGNLTCIATDGNLGIFVRNEGGALWGHVQRFIWDETKEIVLKVKDEFGEDRYVVREVGSGAPPPKFGTPKKEEGLVLDADGNVVEKRSAKAKGKRVKRPSANEAEKISTKKAQRDAMLAAL
jgi:hypothetical protein